MSAETERTSDSNEIAQLGRQVAHDLNNPIGAITTSIYLIEDFLNTANDGRIPASELKPFVESIREECESLKEIVEEFAKYTTLNAILPMPLDLREFVEKRVEDMVRGGVPVTFENHTESVRIEADAPNLQLALRSLVDFAAASSASQISVSVQSGEPVHIIICDNRPKKLDSADDLFEIGSSKQGIRMGLRLPLTRKIVELHGGHIEVGSREDGMTQLEILLPTKSRSSGHPNV